MKSLLIVGAGEYGHLVEEIAMFSGYDQIDYLDDAYSDAVGRIAELSTIQKKYGGCIVAIGNPDIRESVSCKVNNLITLIHPRAMVSPSATIGKGCVIEANAVVSSHSTIGKSSYICAGAVINHNAFVGDFCQVDCNAVVKSGAVLPAKTKLESLVVWSKKFVKKE